MEINFCPFCSAGSNKMIIFDNLLYCKDCNRFFKSEEEELHCHICKKGRIIVSDFPMPNGEILFQCNSCKKMFSAKEYFSKNESN